MEKSIKILLLEDNKNDARLIHNQMLKSGINFQWLQTSELDAFIKTLSIYKPDLILSDYNLIGFTGLDALEVVRKEYPLIPFIIVTGTLNDETAVETIKNGAWDYVVKERLTRLGTAVKNALQLKEEKEKSAMAQEKLKINEERYMLSVEGSNDGIWDRDLKTNDVYYSLRWKSMLGYKDNEIENDHKTWEALLHPDDKKRAISALDKHLKNETSHYRVEFRLKCKDGSYKWILARGKAMFDQNGIPYRIAGSHTDISERKSAEEELQQSYVFRDSLLKIIPFGMHIVDESGTVLFQNDIFKKLSEKNNIGKKCWEIYRDDKVQCPDCPLVIGVNIGKTDIYEAHNVLGKKIFEISHTGMMFEGKKAVLEIFLDITLRKEHEKELLIAKEKAEESDRLKTAFLHNVSHEIRTPLNAIVGFSGLLSDSGLIPEKRKYFTDLIIRSSDQLLSIIDDIIRIASIESMQEKIQENEINLNLMCKLLEEQLSPRGTDKDVTLSFNTYLSDDEAIIVSDTTKLTQILTNLIGNAIKFTQQGYVKFGYTVKDKQLEFFVVDSGIGISEDMQDVIFNRFRQVESTSTRKYGGSGLGLSISKAYTEMLGGNMWLSSELDKGSTFYFTIPYKNVNSKNTPDIPSVKNTSLEFEKPVTILIAEDEDSNFMLLKELLSNGSINIIRALNGLEAVEFCKSNHHIDLVLMDIKMPEMDGLEAMKQIKEFNPDLPIIAQTAYSTEKDKAKALERGCSDFITKPLNRELLLFKITEQLQKQKGKPAFNMLY